MGNRATRLNVWRISQAVSLISSFSSFYLSSLTPSPFLSFFSFYLSLFPAFLHILSLTLCFLFTLSLPLVHSFVLLLPLGAASLDWQRAAENDPPPLRPSIMALTAWHSPWHRPCWWQTDGGCDIALNLSGLWGWKQPLRDWFLCYIHIFL